MCGHARQASQVLESAKNPPVPTGSGATTQNACRGPYGYVPGIEGLESPECPGYVPTRHELIGVATYWLTEHMFFQMLGYYGEPVDRADRAVIQLAQDRLDRLAEVLDQESIDWVIAEVKRDFRKRMGDRDFQAFEAGQPRRPVSWERDELAEQA